MLRGLPPVEIAITCGDDVKTTVSVSDFTKVAIHSNVNVVIRISRSFDDGVCLNRENPKQLVGPVCSESRDNHNSENRDNHSSENLDNNSLGNRGNQSDSAVAMTTCNDIPVAFVQPCNTTPDINQSSDPDTVSDAQRSLEMAHSAKVSDESRNVNREEFTADTIADEDLDHNMTKQGPLANGVSSPSHHAQNWTFNTLSLTNEERTASAFKPSSEAIKLDNVRLKGTGSCAGDTFRPSPAVTIPTLDQGLGGPGEESSPISDNRLPAAMISTPIPCSSDPREADRALSVSPVEVPHNLPASRAPSVSPVGGPYNLSADRAPSVSSVSVPFDMGQSKADMQEEGGQEDTSSVDSLPQEPENSSSFEQLLEYSPSEFQTPSSVIGLIVAPFGSFTPPDPDFPHELEETELLPDARTRATTFFKHRSPRRAAYPSRSKMSGSGGRHSFHIMSLGTQRRITSLLDIRSKNKILREALELSEQKRSRDTRRRVSEANRLWKTYDAEVIRANTSERVRFAKTATLRIVLEEKLSLINRFLKLVFFSSECLGKKSHWEPIMEEYEFKLNL